MKTTPFYEAAKLILLYKDSSFGCCAVIDIAATGNVQCHWSLETRWFQSVFEPSKREKESFNVDNDYWMASQNTSKEQRTNDRIISLLFADLMWRDEHE